MNRLYLFSLILLCSLTGSIHAQSPQLTQFWAAPHYLNPAFTGTSAQQFTGAATIRKQWTSLGQGYDTYGLAIDYATPDRLSFGLLAMKDIAGIAPLTTSVVAPMIAHYIPLSPTWSLQHAYQLTFEDRSIAYGNLTFIDEILYGDAGFDNLTATKVSTFNMSAGILLFSPRAWVGIALSDFITPAVVLSGDNTLLINSNSGIGYAKISAHAGMNIPINFSDYSLLSSVNYRRQQNVSQIDISAGINWKQWLYIGAAYRSLFRNTLDLSKRDAVAAIVSLHFEEFSIGYGYDMTISGLSPFSNGSHEISIKYAFSTKGWRNIQKGYDSSGGGTIRRSSKGRRFYIPRPGDHCPSIKNESGYFLRPPTGKKKKKIDGKIKKWQKKKRRGKRRR